MTSARWELVTRIFDAALDQPQSVWNDFVRRECKGDHELEAEVLRLLAADQEAGSFLENPALISVAARSFPLPLLSTGSVVSGRFEILRFIGQGGMGQVYEALDLELKERVALKAIRPDISSDPRMLSRFRREVQLTRRITHPNVCRTFDIERHSSSEGGGGNLTFLTMELLEGETLADRLRREGRLTTTAALPLVLQMIEALSAAHSVGIIHRDFKPSNVLLVPSDTFASASLRVVVTDFGLARALIPEGQISADQSATSLTGNQALMGTLIYMAPEQFERGEATAASDIYSLGLVMYEMVTGQRPFVDDIPFAEAAKRLRQLAPSPRLSVPELEPAWEATVSKCLDPEPRNRFRSAREVAECLPGAELIGNGHRAVSNRSTHTPIDHSRPCVLYRRTLVVAVCSVLLLSLLGGFLRHYIRRQTPIQFAERDWILVTDFGNHTGEKLFDRIVRDLAVQSLSQSKYANVVPRLSALEATKRTGLKDVSFIDEKLGHQLCLRENYKALLTGDVFKEGSRYVVAMKIEVPGNEPSAISDSESFDSPDQLFAGVDRLTARIRRALGESLPGIQTNTKPLAQVTTPSLEALQRYSTAIDLYGEGEYARCIAIADDAVERDPNFAMAHLLLARAYEKMGDEAKSRMQMGLARNEINRVGEREQHLILALSYSYQLMNDKAAEEYQHLLDIFPDDVDALKGFAYEAFWAGHSDQAIAAQRRATTLSPGDIDSYDTLMTLLIRTNRFDEARAVYNQAQTRQLTAPNLTFLHALATWGAGDLSNAQKLFELLGNQGGNWKLVATLFSGKLLAFQGRMTESVEVFRTGLAMVQTPALEYWVPNFQYQIARAEILTGNATASRLESQRLQRAVIKVPMPINLQRGGRLSIAVGDIQSAEHLEALARRQAGAHPDAFSQMELYNLMGDIALASGHPREAMQEQKTALIFRPWYTPYFSLGEACEAAGNWNCAIEAYRRCLDFKGTMLRDDAGQDWVLAHYSLARAYGKSGDEVSGEAYSQKFLTLFSAADPELPIILQAKKGMTRLRKTNLSKLEKH
ncbi:MAG TPA: protein kinase [Terriglobales bacterium]|nr:protein kinase [Terriglobales bacterium]